MIVLLDDATRENEGDLVILARCITAAAINFMATEGRGLICLALAPEQCDKLQLPLMVPPQANTSPHRTNFTVSIEARDGVSTGISAADRARTIRAAVAPEATSADLVRPGHIFPIRGHHLGLAGRRGHTEGALELSRRAGDAPRAAALVEIMNPDGTMAHRKELEAFANRHQLKIGDIEDLI